MSEVCHRHHSKATLISIGLGAQQIKTDPLKTNPFLLGDYLVLTQVLTCINSTLTVDQCLKYQ